MSDVFVDPDMDLAPSLPRAKRKTVLKVRCLREAFLRGSKGGLVSWWRTRDRFQEGIPHLPLGLSL